MIANDDICRESDLHEDGANSTASTVNTTATSLDTSLPGESHDQRKLKPDSYSAQHSDNNDEYQNPDYLNIDSVVDRGYNNNNYTTNFDSNVEFGYAFDQALQTDSNDKESEIFSLYQDNSIIHYEDIHENNAKAPSPPPHIESVGSSSIGLARSQPEKYRNSSNASYQEIFEKSLDVNANMNFSDTSTPERNDSNDRQDMINESFLCLPNPGESNRSYLNRFEFNGGNVHTQTNSDEDEECFVREIPSNYMKFNHELDLNEDIISNGDNVLIGTHKHHKDVYYNNTRSSSYTTDTSEIKTSYKSPLISFEFPAKAIAYQQKGQNSEQNKVPKPDALWAELDLEDEWPSESENQILQSPMLNRQIISQNDPEGSFIASSVNKDSHDNNEHMNSVVVQNILSSEQDDLDDNAPQWKQRLFNQKRQEEEKGKKLFKMFDPPTLHYSHHNSTDTNSNPDLEKALPDTNINILNNFLNTVISVGSKSSSSSKINYQLSSNSTKHKRGLHLIQEESYRNQDEENNSIHRKADGGNSTYLTAGNMTFETHSYVSAPSMNNDLFKDGKQLQASPNSPLKQLSSGQASSRGRPQLSPLANERIPDRKISTSKSILEGLEQHNQPQNSRLKIFGAYDTFTKDVIHRIVQNTGNSTNSSLSSQEHYQQKSKKGNSTKDHSIEAGNSLNDTHGSYTSDTNNVNENINSLKNRRNETTQSDFMVAADQVMTGLINRPPLSSRMANQLNDNSGCEDDDAYTEASVSGDSYLYSEAQNNIQGLRKMKTSTLKDEDSGDAIENMNILARFRSLSISDPPNIDTLETNGAHFSTLNSFASSRQSRSQSQSRSSIHTASLGSKYKMRQFSSSNDSIKYQELPGELRQNSDHSVKEKSKRILSFDANSVHKRLGPIVDMRNEDYLGESNDDSTSFGFITPHKGRGFNKLNQLYPLQPQRVVTSPSKTPSRNIVNISPGEVSNIEACHEQGLRYDPKVKQWRKPSGELVDKTELGDKNVIGDNQNRSVADDSFTFDTTPEDDDAGNSIQAGRRVQKNSEGQEAGCDDSFRGIDDFAGSDAEEFLRQDSKGNIFISPDLNKVKTANSSCVGTFQFPPLPTLEYHKYHDLSSNESWDSELNSRTEQATAVVMSQMNEPGSSQGPETQRYFSGGTTTTDSGEFIHGSVAVNSRTTRRKISIYDYNEQESHQKNSAVQDEQIDQQVKPQRIESIQGAQWTKANEVLLSPSKNQVSSDRVLSQVSQSSTMVGNGNDQSMEYKEKDFYSLEDKKLVVETIPVESDEINITNILANLEAIPVFNAQRSRDTAHYIPFFNEHDELKGGKENSIINDYKESFMNIIGEKLNVNSHVKIVKNIDCGLQAHNSPIVERNGNNFEEAGSFTSSDNLSGTDISFSSLSHRLLNAFLRSGVHIDTDEETFENTTKIVLPGNSLETIEQLDSLCPKLIKIDISSNSLKSLSGLPESVRELNASENKLGPYLLLNKWRNLQYIDISGNHLIGLSGLNNLIHLREIKADNNRIKSIKAIEKMEGLLAISFNNNCLTSIDFKNARYSRLRSAFFSGNNIKMIKNINTLPDLRELKLNRNDIAVISTSSDNLPHEKLNMLSIADNSLTEFDVSLYPSLNYLNLKGNLLESIHGFDKTMSLKSLYLSSQSTSLDRSVGMVCDKEQKTPVFTLPPNINVQSLFLSNLRVSKILNADQPFTFVSSLDLSGCGLSVLPKNFSQLFFNLRVLDLSFNNISDLSPIFDLPHLTHLYLYQNSIPSLKVIKSVLMNLEFLQVLDCRENPLTKDFYCSIMSSPYMRTLTTTGQIEVYNNYRGDAKIREWAKQDTCYSNNLRKGRVFSSVSDNKAVWDGRRRYIKEIVRVVLKENSPLLWLDGHYVETNNMWKRYTKQFNHSL